MPTLRKPKTLVLTADELAELAGIEASVKVSRGTDDGNVCTLTLDDGSAMTFSRAELLAAIRAADGYVASTPGPEGVGRAPETSRLPMGRAPKTLSEEDPGERHQDGRPHDHIDAGISFEASEDGLTLSWLEDA